MEEIYETDDTFNFEKLYLTKPTVISNGNYFIRFTMGVNGPYLYIQPPKCKTREGIKKAGKKYYSDLMFMNENDQFIRWMENLESYCQQYIYKNRAQWFEGDMEMHDIENYFTSPMKSFKSGKYYLVRSNINTTLGKPILKIYDENEKEVSIESIGETTDIMTILEVQGIKCSARSFQIEIEIKQMMCMKPVNLFERCIIKSKSSGAPAFVETSEIQPIEQPNLGNIISEPDVGGIIVSDSDVSDSSVTENDKITIVEEEEPMVNEEPMIKNEEPNEMVNEMVNEMEEVEFSLEQLAESESIQIKKRNDVYYEMYKEARRKAKIAKDLALSSYLEAKRIKNTYMLEDIKDSDDSDLESDFEGSYSSSEQNIP